MKPYGIELQIHHSCRVSFIWGNGLCGNGAAGFDTKCIYEFTPGGVKSTFASGLSAPYGLAFQGVTLPVPEPSASGLLAIGVTALLFCRRCVTATPR
jgi:hypothetical protein